MRGSRNVYVCHVWKRRTVVSAVIENDSDYVTIDTGEHLLQPADVSVRGQRHLVREKSRSLETKTKARGRPPVVSVTVTFELLQLT